MKRILVLGASGFVGANLCERLLSKGFEVHGYSRQLRNLSHLKSAVPPVSNFEWHQGSLDDINNVTSLVADLKIDTIVHSAGMLIPSSGAADFDREMRNIILPTFSIMNHVDQSKVRVIYVSSGGACYDEAGCFAGESELPYTDSFYALSKRVCEERIMLSVNKLGRSHVILRPSNIYGKYQRDDGKQGLLGVLIKNIQQGKCTEIWGNGSAIRDYVSVKTVGDCVECFISDEGISGVFNIGTGVGLSVLEVIDIVRKASFDEFDVTHVKPDFTDNRKVVLNVEKLRRNTNVTWGDPALDIGSFVASCLSA